MSESDVLWFEDLAVGMTATSPGRTVTEADVVAFAALSGDWNPLHTDAEAAAASAFGERVAHGLLGQAIASGLFTRTRFSERLQPALVALLGIEWRFEAPIVIGDTIHVEAQITGLRPTRRPNQGVLVLDRRVVNQAGVCVQTGTTSMLVRRHPDAGEKGLAP